MYGAATEVRGSVSSSEPTAEATDNVELAQVYGLGEPAGLGKM